MQIKSFKDHWFLGRFDSQASSHRLLVEDTFLQFPAEGKDRRNNTQMGRRQELLRGPIQKEKKI